jgi:hypothetical protein
MTRTGQKLAHGVAAAFLIAALLGCSTFENTMNTVRSKDGATTEKEARNVAPEDPLARPIQVGWTSARATHCGFIFSPEQLRTNFLASEAQAGATPEQMQKIERAYDYTRDSVLASIKDNLAYCNKARTDAIRRDLNRYLAGDYAPSARMAQ